MIVAWVGVGVGLGGGSGAGGGGDGCQLCQGKETGTPDKFAAACRLGLGYSYSKSCTFLPYIYLMMISEVFPSSSVWDQAVVI